MITLLEFKLLLENYREALSKKGVDSSIIDFIDKLDNKQKGEAIAKLMRNPRLELIDVIPEKKFRASDPRIHAFIQTVDPSRDLKYYRVVYSWIQNGSVQTNNRFAGSVKESLGFFHENKKFFDTSYLNKYETFQDFWRAYEKALKASEETERKKKERELERNAPKIYEDSKYKVYMVKSYEASCILGKGTRWCTASRESRLDAESYLKIAPLYTFISKSGPHKYQLFIAKDRIEFNDELNSEVSAGSDQDVMNTALDCFAKNNMINEFSAVFDMASSEDFRISSKHKKYFLDNVDTFADLLGFLYSYDTTKTEFEYVMTKLMTKHRNETIMTMISRSPHDSYLKNNLGLIHEFIEDILLKELKSDGLRSIGMRSGLSGNGVFTNLMYYLWVVSENVMGNKPPKSGSMAQNMFDHFPAKFRQPMYDEMIANPSRLEQFLKAAPRNGMIGRWHEIEDTLLQDVNMYSFYFRVYPEALENEEEMDKLLKQMSFGDLLRHAQNKMDSIKHREAVKSRIENGVSFSRIPPEMFEAITRYLQVSGLRSIQYLKNILALEDRYNDALYYVIRADRTEEAKKVLWNTLLKQGFYRPIMEYVRIFLNSPDAKFESWLEGIEPRFLKSWMQKSDFAPDLIRYYAQKYNRKLPDRVVNEMPYYYAAEYATKITGKPVTDDDLHQQIMASTSRHLGSAVKDYQHRFGAGVNQR